MGRKYERTALDPALNKKDEELKGSTSMFGQTVLSSIQYNSAMRITMDTSHQRQCVTLLNPDFPYVFTGAENTVGKHSDGYIKTDKECTVYKKIEKYRDLVDIPEIYILVLYTKSTDTYDMIEIKPYEELTENYAYKYNHEYADMLSEGDKIPSGTVLTKSPSYDEYGNYGYGKNVATMYTFDNRTMEDACVISESFAEEGSCLEQSTIDVTINPNDFLLNIHGNSKHYRALPKIGEPLDGIVLATRRFITDQMFYDFKDESLSIIDDNDRCYIANEGSHVVDYSVYCNEEDLEDNIFNREIIALKESQEEYYQEIYDTCMMIKESGSNYTKNINHHLSIARDMLDHDSRWIRTSNNTDFAGVTLRISFINEKPLDVGSKIAGRYGNKSVISKVLPDDQMPVTESGLHVQLLMNVRGVINRTTAEPLFETDITYCIRMLIKHMKEDCKTLKEREDLLFKFMDIANKPQSEEMKQIYHTFSTDSEKEEFINSCMDDFIQFRQPPMFEYKPFFYRLQELYNTFDWLDKGEDVYVYTNGRYVKSLRKFRIGYMYMLVLKQTGRSGFIARSTGAINACEYPTKSNGNKNNQKDISDNPIRFGEYETIGFEIGTKPEELALFEALFRTSPKARADFIRYQVQPFSKKLKESIPDKYTSRVAEMCNVYLKSIGLGMRFIDEDDELKEMDLDHYSVYTDDDNESYLCDELTFKNIQRRKEAKKDILMHHPLIDNDELHDMIEERLQDTKYVCGEVVDVSKFIKD